MSVDLVHSADSLRCWVACRGESRYVGMWRSPANGCLAQHAMVFAEGRLAPPPPEVLASFERLIGLGEGQWRLSDGYFAHRFVVNPLAGQPILSFDLDHEPKGSDHEESRIRWHERTMPVLPPTRRSLLV